jgi:hypothetical protein
LDVRDAERVVRLEVGGQIRNPFSSPATSVKRFLRDTCARSLAASSAFFVST